MADKDYSIKISEDGSENVIKAFNDIDAAEDKATKGAEELGKASEKAQGKMSKLGAALKAGAGQAAGAAAASVGLATALNDGITSGGNAAIASLSALSGVAGAFGPVGQIVATGASLAATAIGIFSGEAEEAYEITLTLGEQWERSGEQASFLAKTIGKVSSEFDKAAVLANKATAAREAFFASVGGSSLLPEQFRRGGAELSAVVKNTEEEIGKLQTTLDLLYKQGATGIGDYSDAIAATTAKLTQQQAVLKAQQTGLENFSKSAKNAIAGPPAEAAKEVVKEVTKAAKGATKAVGDLYDYISKLGAGFSSAGSLVAANVTLAASNAQNAANAQLAEEQRLSDGLISLATERGIALKAQDDKAKADREAAAQEQEDSLSAQEEAFLSYGSAVADSMGMSVIAAIAAGESIKQVLNEQLKALALEAVWQTLKATATGLFYTATGNVEGAGAAFASAGVWAAIAAGAGIATAATSGGSGGGSGGAASSGGSGTSSDLGTPSNQGNSGPSYVTYIIENNGVVGLDRDLDRRFAQGTRREEQRPGGIRQNRR